MSYKKDTKKYLEQNSGHKQVEEDELRRYIEGKSRYTQVEREMMERGRLKEVSLTKPIIMPEKIKQEFNKKHLNSRHYISHIESTTRRK